MSEMICLNVISPSREDALSTDENKGATSLTGASSRSDVSFSRDSIVLSKTSCNCRRSWYSVKTFVDRVLHCDGSLSATNFANSSPLPLIVMHVGEFLALIYTELSDL
jgi:hypothetical protein